MTSNLTNINGLDVEANPFMRSLFEYHFNAALAYKIASFGLLVAIMKNRAVSHSIELTVAIAVTLLYTGIVIYSLFLTYFT